MLNTSGNMYIESVQAQLCSGANRLHRRNTYFSNKYIPNHDSKQTSWSETNVLKRNNKLSYCQCLTKAFHRLPANEEIENLAPKPNVRDASLGCSCSSDSALAEAWQWIRRRNSWECSETLRGLHLPDLPSKAWDDSGWFLCFTLNMLVWRAELYNSPHVSTCVTVILHYLLDRAGFPIPVSE